MDAMGERVRLEERESAATGAIHAGGDSTRLAKSSSSYAAPGNDAASFSYGVGRGPVFSKALSARNNPNGPAFHQFLPQPGEKSMGHYPLHLGEPFKYEDAYGNPDGNTHGRDGFNRAGFNRHGVHRAGYDMDGHYRGHQHGTVFPSAITGAMFRRHVRPPRVSMDVDPAWVVGGSARAARATPRERCVQRRPRSWQVRPRCVGDENDAALVSMVCCWVFGLRNCTPARARGAVEIATKARY